MKRWWTGWAGEKEAVREVELDKAGAAGTWIIVDTGERENVDPGELFGSMDAAQRKRDINEARRMEAEAEFARTHAAEFERSAEDSARLAGEARARAIRLDDRVTELRERARAEVAS